MVSGAKPISVRDMKPGDHTTTLLNLGAPASEMNKREAMLAAILPAMIKSSPYVLWKRGGSGQGTPNDPRVEFWELDEEAVGELIEDAEDFVYLVLRRDE